MRTAAGPVGLVHAAPTARHWETMCTRIEDGHGDTIWLAMNSTARARGDARRAAEGVPVEGTIHGVRAVLTGHAVVALAVTPGRAVPPRAHAGAGAHRQGARTLRSPRHRARRQHRPGRGGTRE